MSDKNDGLPRENPPAEGSTTTDAPRKPGSVAECLPESGQAATETTETSTGARETGESDKRDREQELDLSDPRLLSPTAIALLQSGRIFEDEARIIAEVPREGQDDVVTYLLAALDDIDARVRQAIHGYIDEAGRVHPDFYAELGDITFHRSLALKNAGEAAGYDCSESLCCCFHY